MKTIYIKGNKTPIIANIEKNEVDVLERSPMYSLGIDALYVVPNDCEVKITRKGVTVVKKAQKGDVIIQFYDNDNYPELVAIVKNAELKKNIVAILAKQAADQASAELRASYCDTCKACDAPSF